MMQAGVNLARKVMKKFPRPWEGGASPKKASVIIPTNLKRVLKDMGEGQRVSLTMHMKGCGHCNNLMRNVIEPMDKEGSYPYPHYLMEMNGDIARQAKADPVLMSLMEHASGVPTTMVIQKHKGQYKFQPLVGYMPKDKFAQSLKQSKPHLLIKGM
jgi:thioredoxin-related protein